MAVVLLVSLLASLALALVHNTIAQADSAAELALPSAVGNISLGGGPHNWAGCTIVNGVLGSDCLGNHPWNSIDWGYSATPLSQGSK
jgi:hypothetical protein